MKYSFACTLAAIAVGVNAQGAPSGLKPSGSAPAGCVSSGSGTYEVTIVKPAPAASKRDVVEKRATTCGTNALVVQLSNGVMTDSKGRIGSIVANRQFQFDGPPAQTGAIYDAGWSFCPNTSIAIGPTTNFYQCLSGNFYNLYDQPSESNCSLVNLDVIPCTYSSGAGSASVISQQSDGQPTASSAPYISQSSDGQVEATTPAAIVSQQSDGQPTASSAPVVTQISDGQPQASGAGNATVPTTPPVATGAAGSIFASGAFVAVGAVAALFL